MISAQPLRVQHPHPPLPKRQRGEGALETLCTPYKSQTSSALEQHSQRPPGMLCVGHQGFGHLRGRMLHRYGAPSGDSQVLAAPINVGGIAMYHSQRRNLGWSEILCNSRCASDQAEEKGKN